MPVERLNITDASGKIDRQAWLALRAQDITASDVPAVCGYGLYGSPAKVWAEKRGLLPPTELTDAMKRGLWGEAAVFDALAWEHPEWELRRAKIYLRDPDARLGATPDGAAIIPGRDGVCIVQTKVIAEPIFCGDWLEDPDDDVQHGTATPPTAYQLQTLTESHLADASAGLLAVLVVGTFRWTLREFWVERHTGAEAMVREKVGAFWRDYLDPGIQPPIDAERDSRLVKQLFPRDDGTEIDLTAHPSALALVQEREDVKADIKRGRDRVEELDTELKAILGNASSGHLADGRILSWKLQQRAAYQVAANEFRQLRVLKGQRGFVDKAMKTLRRSVA